MGIYLIYSEIFSRICVLITDIVHLIENLLKIEIWWSLLHLILGSKICSTTVSVCKHGYKVHNSEFLQKKSGFFEEIAVKQIKIGFGVKSTITCAGTLPLRGRGSLLQNLHVIVDSRSFKRSREFVYRHSSGGALYGRWGNCRHPLKDSRLRGI